MYATPDSLGTVSLGTSYSNQFSKNKAAMEKGSSNLQIQLSRTKTLNDL